jgi:hypothetical protein
MASAAAQAAGAADVFQQDGVGRVTGRQVAAGSGAGRSGDGGVRGQVDEGVAGPGVEADQQRRGLRVQPGGGIVRAGAGDPPDADGYWRVAGDDVDGAGGDQLVQAERIGDAARFPGRVDGRAVTGPCGLSVRGRVRLAPVVAGVHTHPRPNGAADLPADRPRAGQPAPNRRPVRRDQPRRCGPASLAADPKSPVGTTPPGGSTG